MVSKVAASKGGANGPSGPSGASGQGSSTSKDTGCETPLKSSEGSPLSRSVQAEKPSGKQQEIQNGSVKAQNSSQKGSSTVCSICQKEIPNSNFTLHQLRCAPPKVDAKPAPVKDDKVRAPSAKSKKKKDKKKTPGPPEEDFDALIASAMQMNSSCHSPRCKENATILGQNCMYCVKRFCLKHHMAEMHGCGAAAKSHARQMISREGVLYRGSGIPDKKPDPTKRAHLQRKFDKKLDALTADRKAKSKDK